MRFDRWQRWFFTLMCLGFASVAVAWATPPANAPAAKPVVAKPAAAAKVDSRPSFTPEREAAALAFVSMHHAELQKVLNQLKAMQREEYESAIRQLFQTSEQLARLKDQDVQRYELDLEDWKIKSRIQLLAARAGISEDPALDAQLKELVEKQVAARILRLTLEQNRAKERLQRVETQLGKVTTERDADIERQYTTLMRGVKKARTAMAKQTAAAKTQGSK